MYQFKKENDYGIIVFEEEAFNYLDVQLENFVKRMDRIRERSEDKAMSQWLDTQDVCQMLNICPPNHADAPRHSPVQLL